MISPILFTLPLMLPVNDGGCAKIDVVVLVDISGSIKGHESIIRTALVSFVDNLDISEDGIHAGIVAFSNGASTLCELTGDHDKFDDTFGRIESDDGNTNMKAGLIGVQEEINIRGRADALKVVIVISDGETEYKEQCLEMAKMLGMMNVLTCSVLIRNFGHDEDFMRKLGGECYLETNYQHLYNELAKLDMCL